MPIRRDAGRRGEKRPTEPTWGSLGRSSIVEPAHTRAELFDGPTERHACPGDRRQRAALGRGEWLRRSCRRVPGLALTKPRPGTGAGHRPRSLGTRALGMELDVRDPRVGPRRRVGRPPTGTLGPAWTCWSTNAGIRGCGPSTRGFMTEPQPFLGGGAGRLSATFMETKATGDVSWSPGRVGGRECCAPAAGQVVTISR